MLNEIKVENEHWGINTRGARWIVSQRWSSSSYHIKIPQKKRLPMCIELSKGFAEYNCWWQASTRDHRTIHETNSLSLLHSILYSPVKTKCYFVSNGTVKITLKKLGSSTKVTNVDDCDNYFPEVDWSVRRWIDSS